MTKIQKNQQTKKRRKAQIKKITPKNKTSKNVKKKKKKKKKTHDKKNQRKKKKEEKGLERVLPPEAARFFCLKKRYKKSCSKFRPTKPDFEHAWVKKNTKEKRWENRGKTNPWTLNLEGRTPPFWRLTCLWLWKNHVVDKLCCGVDKHGSIALVTVHACSGYAQWTQYVVVFYVDGLCCRRRLLTHLCKQAREATTQTGLFGWRLSTRRSSELNCVATRGHTRNGQRRAGKCFPCRLVAPSVAMAATVSTPSMNPTRTRKMRSIAPVAIYRLWAQSVRQPARQLRPVDIDTEPSFSCIRREKNQRTWDRLVTLMRKVCCQLSPFSHAQVRETRIRTMFRFVSKTEIKSRPGKRANQDSPWKTKRAYSCWGQIWDPEARTSSRVW